MEVLSSPRGARPRSGWPDRLHTEWPAAFPCLGPHPGVHDGLVVTVVEEESDAVGVLVCRVETALLALDWKRSQAKR